VQGIGRMEMSEPLADDCQIVKRVAQGDRQALAEIYARYQRPLFHYLLQLTPDYGLAEEILQDTLVAVWKSAHSFEARSSVLTWLIGVARRQAHNTLRRHKLPFVDESELAALPASDPEPEEFALASVARDELVAAFRQLAPVHREILALTFVQELSYQESAQVLGVPIGTVKSRLSNAKKALRTLLESREGTKR
jgi:RNA polymerase sigma factor (sigma-70 family)